MNLFEEMDTMVIDLFETLAQATKPIMKPIDVTDAIIDYFKTNDVKENNWFEVTVNGYVVFVDISVTDTRYDLSCNAYEEQITGEVYIQEIILSDAVKEDCEIEAICNEDLILTFLENN